MRQRLTVSFVAMVAVLSCVPVAFAQPAPCRFLCSPGLNVEPTITVEHLFNAPRVSEGGSEPQRLTREKAFEIVVALDVPTTVPRLGFTLEAILVPFGRTSSNPFTGGTSESLGGDIRDNPVEIETEVNVTWLTGEQTGGWVDSHFDIVDKFSPAERPGDRSVYTHKLNFELDTALVVFRWLPEQHWLRNVELEGSLDYVATGLPRAGDVVPSGGERFLDDASPWSFSVVFVIPIIAAR